MSTLQTVLMLCDTVERQNHIIQAMALRLGELGDLTCRDEIAEADRILKERYGEGPE